MQFLKRNHAAGRIRVVLKRLYHLSENKQIDWSNFSEESDDLVQFFDQNAITHYFFSFVKMA